VLRQIVRSTERQHSDAGPSLVDGQERASLDVLAVRFECLGDDADNISESRSCVRICTTLGPLAAPAARIAEKSRSFVMRMNSCSFAHVRISTSGAVAAPMVDQWTASNP
jgi:hypothetical protein